MGAFMELVKCTHDHDDYEFGYKSIEEKDYCCKGNYLNGVKCSVCALTFVSRRVEKNKQKSKSVIPSTKKPVRVCIGQVMFSCTHSLCNDCFIKKLFLTQANSSRKKRSRSGKLQ